MTARRLPAPRAGVAIAIVVTVHLRRTGVFAIFAVLAVVARLFTYHRAYDDVLLAFLVIEAAARAMAPEAATRWRIAWLACGASLWLPYSLYVPAWAQSAQIATWVGVALLMMVPTISGERDRSSAAKRSADHVNDVRKGGLEPP